MQQLTIYDFLNEPQPPKVKRGALLNELLPMTIEQFVDYADLEKITVIHAKGAQGYNKYWVKKESESDE